MQRQTVEFAVQKTNFKGGQIKWYEDKPKKGVEKDG